ncbi:hypothetical protein [uncultured Bacteroides sp.]|uniref:hypothetical protein n=1 Tax=uncultured Bacteroides sp. TaxID=162156 RepID=UPI0026205E26|nr:hypothetical protein [uncultured Bacteroides sp.]
MDELAKRAPNNDLPQVMLKQGWGTLTEGQKSVFAFFCPSFFVLSLFFKGEYGSCL